MAIGAKHLIPRCTGARILPPCALSLVFCPPLVVDQDQPPTNKSAIEYHLLAQANIMGDMEEVRLFLRAERLAIRTGIGESDVSATRKDFE